MSQDFEITVTNNPDSEHVVLTMPEAVDLIALSYSEAIGLATLLLVRASDLLHETIIPKRQRSKEEAERQEGEAKRQQEEKEANEAMLARHNIGIPPTPAESETVLYPPEQA
jgi:hypothetical protein